MRRRPAGGFAMLSALVVMAVGASLALVAVGAAAGLSQVAGADVASWRTDSLTGEAVEAVTDQLRWRPPAATGTLSDAPAEPGGRWRATWLPALPVAGALWDRVEADVASASGQSARRTNATVELRAAPWAAGVVCRAEALVAAPLEVAGSGVYVGGSLSGRENVRFAAPPAAAPTGPPVDLVHGDLWPAAAVHAGGSIFAAGVEEHAAGAAGAPEDSDAHAGSQPDDSLVSVPGAAFVAAAREHAVAPGDALDGDGLDLSRLRLTPAAGADDAGGVCLVVAAEGPITLSGEASADPRLLLVVCGDAVVGRAGVATSLTGSLVVTGSLTVEGPIAVEGCVCAGSLAVYAPMSVDVQPLWRRHLLGGACDPRVVEIGVAQAG